MPEMSAQKYFKEVVEKSTLGKSEINLIICYVLKIKLAGFYIYEKLISPNQKSKIESLIVSRESGVPFAYLTNSKHFWTMELYVDNNVLIPRPETEKIIELFLKFNKKSKKIKVLDLGTGSGAIALSIAKECRNTIVTAVDYSDKALEIAKKNAIKNNIENVTFLTSDWFSNISTRYDYIISNPPYIAENDLHLKKLINEPLKALVSGEKGLDDIKHIIVTAKKYLKKCGTIMLEHGYNQKNEVQKILKENGYTKIKTYNDLSNIPRITVASYI